MKAKTAARNRNTNASGSSRKKNSSGNSSHDTKNDNSSSACWGDGQTFLQRGRTQSGEPVEMTAYESAGTGGKLLFTWLNPVINICMSRNIRAEELPPLGPSDDVAYWAEAIDRSLAKEEARAAAAAISAAEKHAVSSARNHERAIREKERQSAAAFDTAEKAAKGEDVVVGIAGDERTRAATGKPGFEAQAEAAARAKTGKVDAAKTEEQQVAAAAVRYKPSLLRALWVTFRRTLLWTLTVYIIRDGLGVVNTYFLKELLHSTGGDLGRWRRTLMVGIGISLVQLAQIFVDTAVDFYACRIYMRVEICLLTALFKRILHPDPFIPPAAVIKGASIPLVFPAPDPRMQQKTHRTDNHPEQQHGEELQQQESKEGKWQRGGKGEGQQQPQQQQKGDERTQPQPEERQQQLQKGEKQLLQTPRKKMRESFVRSETQDECSSSARNSDKLEGKGGSKENVFNLMFVDIPSVASVIFTFLDICLLPVRLSFAALMLYSQVGLEVELPGLAVVLGTTALTILLEIGSARMKTAYMRYRDVRLDKSHEMLAYMKTVRLMGWEDIAEARIRHWRQLEMRQRSKRMYISAVSSWLSTSAAMAMSVATFVSYSLPLLHRESFRLRPELAIPVIHLLDNFIGPITDFPYAVSNTIEGLISLNRLQRCFFSPVLQQLPALLLPPLPAIQAFPAQQQPSTADVEGSSRSSTDHTVRGEIRLSASGSLREDPDTWYSRGGRDTLAARAAGETAEPERQPLLTKSERQAAEGAERKEHMGTPGEDYAGEEDQQERGEETGALVPSDIAREAQMLLNILAASPNTEIYFSHASFAWLPHTYSPFSSIANLAIQVPPLYCRSERGGGLGDYEGGKKVKKREHLARAEGAGPDAAATDGPSSFGSCAPPRVPGELRASAGRRPHASAAVLQPSLLAVLPADAATPTATSCMEGGQAAASLSPSAPATAGGPIVSTVADITAAIDNVSLHVKRGELLLVTGPPGSGKSSLLHAILQQRELLLLNGCSFVRSAFCIDLPGDHNDFSTAEGATTLVHKISPETHEPPHGGPAQQKGTQQDINTNCTQREMHKNVTTTDSVKGSPRNTPLATPLRSSSPSTTDREVEKQVDEEMEALLLRAEIDAAAPIGYVSQEPWLQVGTIRENIMFGCAPDEQLYEEVIEAFDLSHDYSTWPGGDSRFIDEGGADLSGGQRMRIAMARAVYVCLAYRRRAAANAATVRLQLKWRERQLEQQLRVVAAAGTAANGAQEKSLQQQLRLEKEKRQLQEREAMQSNNEVREQGKQQHKEEEEDGAVTATDTIGKAAAHGKRQVREAAGSDKDEEEQQEKAFSYRAMQPQQQARKEGAATMTGVRGEAPASDVSAYAKRRSGPKQRIRTEAEEWGVAAKKRGTAATNAREGLQERSAEKEGGKAPQAAEVAEDGDNSEEEEKEGEHAGTHEELALPYLFCFDEAFSSLDPGVAERVFRNLFGRNGLLRDAAVVLATSEQSLFSLVSSLYLDQVEDDFKKQQRKNSQQPQQQRKTEEKRMRETENQGREEVQEQERHRKQEQEEKSQQQREQTQKEEIQPRQQESGRDGSREGHEEPSQGHEVQEIEEGRDIAAAPKTPDGGFLVAAGGAGATVSELTLPRGSIQLEVPKPTAADSATSETGAAGSGASFSAGSAAGCGSFLLETGARRERGDRRGKGQRSAPFEGDSSPAAGAGAGHQMKLSVCCLEKGRVVWKGSMKAFQRRITTGPQQQPFSVVTVAADVQPPTAAVRASASGTKETLEGAGTAFPPSSQESRFLRPPRSKSNGISAEEESDEAAATAELTPRSTIESVLSFLPMQSIDEAEVETAAGNGKEEDKASRERAAGKEEADELLKYMMVHEQAASGQVGWPSYKWYLRATGIFLSLLFVCLLLLTAFTDFASDVWIAQWTGLSPTARRTRAAKNVGTRKEPPNVEGPVGLLGEERKMREAETQAARALAEHGQNVQTGKKSFVAPAETDARATHTLYLWFYVGLAISNIFLELMIKVVETRGSLRAADRIHDKLLHIVCNAPLWFYDQNPIGRIVNRLSTDVAVLDAGIFKRMGLALTAFFSCTLSLVVLGVTTVWTLPLLPLLLLGVYALVFRYYRSTCREIQRASLISFSPLCSSFSESLSGREVIFALRRARLFTARNAEQVELAQRAKLMHWALSAWGSIRLQLLSFPLALVNAVGPRLAALFSAYTQQQQFLKGGGGGGVGEDFFSIVQRLQRSQQHHLGYLGLAVSYSLSIASALRRMMHHFTHLEKEMCSLERIHDYVVEAEIPAPRRLAEVAVQPSVLAGAAARPQPPVPLAYPTAVPREVEQGKAPSEEKEGRSNEEKGKMIDTPALLKHASASPAGTRPAGGILHSTAAASPVVSADEETEEEERARAVPARRGILLEGVEVRYRRAGFQYLSQVREAIELELQQLRTARLQRQRQQEKQKLREHPAAASTIDERIALLLHAPGTMLATGADEQQSKEERLLLILEGLGEGKRATFLPPSLRINYAAAGPTEHIGVVGRTGSGKSTLLQTLSGVLRCYRGSVKLDGMDISLFPPEILREIIAVLPQRPIIFSGMTVRDVIDPRGRYDDEALWKALDRVGISRLIKSLAPARQLYTPVRATETAAQQLPAERNTSSLSSRTTGLSGNSAGTSNTAAATTTWEGQEASQGHRRMSSAAGFDEKQQANPVQHGMPPRISHQSLTHCQLRYLALARLILQAPTCRLVLVDEPPTDAFEEAHEACRTTHADAPAEEGRLSTAAPASAAHLTTSVSSSVVNRSATLTESERQTAQREGSAVVGGRSAGAGVGRQHQRPLFTPIPELLKRLFAHCTVFIVAHHVDSLQGCDKVWLMWKGRIIGQCMPADICTDKQLADAMKKAVTSWKATCKRVAAGKIK